MEGVEGVEGAVEPEGAVEAVVAPREDGLPMVVAAGAEWGCEKACADSSPADASRAGELCAVPRIGS